MALMRDPYEFISRQCRSFGSEVFEMKLLLRRTLCMSGAEAAQVFYDPARFKRAGAAPLRLQESLLGVGGVQGLDGAEHTQRKQMFLALMSSERLQQLAATMTDTLVAAAERWSSMEQVVLYDQLHEVLTRSVCQWAGVPLREQEVTKRARQLSAMFDRAGAIGPPHWWSRHARNQAERWIAEIVEEIRAGKIDPPQESAARRIAFYQDSRGQRLNPKIAAVELLNVLRPTVALSVYIVFMVHALHLHPEYRSRLRQQDGKFAQAFVQEVRRFYPFFPAVPAIVRESFEWKGMPFEAGTRVLLDLHGTNHDPGVWKDPSRFVPDRFLDWQDDAYTFIPQGGGDHLRNHRCAGEWLSIALLQAALEFFVSKLSYALPEQELEIDRTRLPALPRSRLVISNVRLI
ncbi:cytochrome P450 [Steroidobacter sp. S1-65]|uniref:Cytochrome P450 n=2 Tax=Steroidobacter gossypii TaxID=2805490 RepID=A0ABS1WQV4_9GAMM|nr:cytochrome P450 [Steroidobacter gossypii]